MIKTYKCERAPAPPRILGTRALAEGYVGRLRRECRVAGSVSSGESVWASQNGARGFRRRRETCQKYNEAHAHDPLLIVFMLIPVLIFGPRAMNGHGKYECSWPEHTRQTRRTS